MKTFSLPILDGAGRISPKLWRSAEERAAFSASAAEAAAAVVVQEFPASAEPPSEFTSRRSFVQLLGAGIALGASGCFSKPAEKILPYTRKPSDLSPGRPLHYATMATVGGYATGLLVTAWEGRPTKIEGNPDHPSSLGSPGIFEQASLYSLYDPNRARELRSGGQGKALRSFLLEMKALGDKHRADGGAKLRLLVEPSGSPLLADLRKKILAAFPKAKIRAWSSLSRDAHHEGIRLATGQPLEAGYDLSGARVIVALDADFLSCLPGNLALARQFSRSRAPEHGQTMSRLYAAESQLTVTGATADHRLRIRAGEIGAVALALLTQLKGKLPGLAGLGSIPAAQLSPKATRWVAALANDLVKAGPGGVLLVGDRQPAEVHAIALAVNSALGALGKSVFVRKAVLGDESTGLLSGHAGLKELAAEMNAGAVEALIVTAWNPVHTAPQDVDFAAALKKVGTSVYTAVHEDETAPNATWFVPQAHELESWGDGRAHDGTITMRQPLVSPLFNGLTEADVLSALLGEAPQSTYERLRALHKGGAGLATGEAMWTNWVADGLQKGTAYPAQQPALQLQAITLALSRLSAPAPEGVEVVFAPDYKVLDGRYANNGWLQEMPDPITKLCWDNAVMFSPETAKRVGVETGDFVEVELKGNKIRGAAIIVPGQADESVTLPLGYGRTNARETVANGVGFNANVLRRSDAPWIDRGAKVTKVEGHRKLAITHSHWTMEGRALALDVKLTELESNKLPVELEEQREDHPTIYAPVDYSKGAKWAMAIDLSKCTGCSACLIACQSENNIPVVGYEQVTNSREMNWLRIDRYYQGDLNDPQVITQPVACVHCENAPCEYVCPVNATVHSDEGLNEMVYNRCVGTRYCSNNCPYKVRRFNFLRYNDDYTDVEKMKFNPDVTVRGRGVMEKCTYCVQRIERARIETRVEGRAMNDTDIVTACQQACPAEAITFGSLTDPSSRVSKLQLQERSYRLLNELNTKPRTWHLARVRNPNPELG